MQVSSLWKSPLLLIFVALSSFERMGCVCAGAEAFLKFRVWFLMLGIFVGEGRGYGAGVWHVRCGLVNRG